MKFAFVIASLLVLSVSADLRPDWEAFKLKHGKVYESAEMDEYRFGLWSETVKEIELHNRRFAAGEVTYTMGLNKMSDMTAEEKRRMRGGKGIMTTRVPNKKATSYKSRGAPLPEEVDWRKNGSVNAVKDQGQCGSCWTFSAVASIEGQYFRKFGQLLSFSEQQLVDCVKSCNGCSGGLMDLAFSYLQQNGLETEVLYPYKAKDQDCKYNASKASFSHLVGFEDLPTMDEHALQEAIATIGTISVAIDATNHFQNYESGVFTDESCGGDAEDLDHGVAVVGYGKTQDGLEYYIVRNSWGSDWGEDGYIRMARNKNNMCGIATMASYPTFE